MIALGLRHRNAMGAGIRGMYLRGAVIGLAFGMIGDASMSIMRRTSADWRRASPSGYLAGTPSRQAWVENVWRSAGWLCILMTAFCFAQMYLWFARATQ